MLYWVQSKLHEILSTPDNMKVIHAFVVIPKSFTAARMLIRTRLLNHNQQLNPLPLYLRLTKLTSLSSYLEKSSWFYFFIYLTYYYIMKYDPTATGLGT